MKKLVRLYLISVMFALYVTPTFAQVEGDYRSIGNGSWNALSSWERYNGSTWEVPSAVMGWPGQFAGTKNVSIRSGDEIAIPEEITTLSMGTVTVEGVLYIVNHFTFTLTTDHLNLSVSPAGIQFGDHAILNLPESSILLSPSGSLTGICTGDERIYFGSTAYYSCASNGSEVGLFSDLMTNGGNPSLTLTSGSGSNYQNLYLSGSISPITYSVGGGATSVTVSGLPAGVSGSYDSGTKIFTISGTPTEKGTFNYNVIASGPGSQLTTQSGRIIVLIVPTVDNVDNQDVCSGASTEKITFTGTGTYYNWTNSNALIGIATSGTGDIPSFTAIYSPITATFNVTPYYKDNLSGLDTNGDTKMFTITVLPTPTVTASEYSKTINSGTSPDITLSGTVDNTTFNWTVSRTGVSGASAGSGTSINQLLTATGSSTGTATYTITPTANGCNGTPVEVIISVLPTSTTITPIVDDIGNQTVCNNTFTTAINFSGTATSYNWSCDQPSIGIAASSTGNIASFTATNSGTSPITATITVTPVYSASGVECSGTSKSFTITVKPSPVITAMPNPAEICSGQNVSIALTSTLSSTSLNWTSEEVGVSGASASGSSATIDQTLNATGTTPGTATYTINSMADGCPGDPLEVVVTVNPDPVLTSSHAVNGCSGSVFDYVPTSEPAGANFEWIRENVLGIQNESSAGTGNPMESLVNTTTSDIPVVYHYTINYHGCVSSADVTATIKVMPYLLSSTDQTEICSASTFKYTPVASISAATITWQRDIVDGISNSASSGTGSVSEPLINLTNHNVTVNYQFTLSNEGCENTQIVPVVVKPIPTVTPIADQTYCVGAVVPEQVITSAVTSTTFSWNNNNTAIGLPLSGTNVVNAFTATSDNPSAPISSTIYIRPSADGCTGDWSHYSITANPLPAATISSSAATVCQNSASPVITFTGTNSTAPYTFTYKVNGGTEQTIKTDPGNSSITLDVPTDVATVYKYELVSVEGSTGCSQTQFGSVSVIIKPSPSVTIAGTTAICQFGASPSITLTGSVTSAPYTFTYAINGGANHQITTATGVDQTTILVPTDYSGSFDYDLITVSDAAGCSFSPTLHDHHAIVTIHESPTATISGTTTVCENQASPSVTFTATGGGTPYIFTYKIDEGADQTISTTGSDNSVTWPVPTDVIGSHTYTILGVSGAGGCYHAESGSVIVTVNPAPSASIAASTTAVCQNGTSPYVTLTGSGGSLPYTFVYSINGGTPIPDHTTSGSNLVIPVPTAVSGDFTYALISVKDGSVTGCESAIIGSSVTIKVKQLPTATISPSQGTCLNESAPEVLFAGSGASEPYTFTYKLNGGTEETLTTTSGNTISLNIPTNAPLSNVYTLTKVSSDGCSNPHSGSTTVVVHPLPSATISGAASVCQSGSKPVITLTGSGGTAPYTFSYSINGVAAPDLTTSGNSIVIEQETSVAGTYTYRLLGVTDQYGCHVVLDQAIDVVVKPLPTATIIPSTTTPVCQNSVSPQITFTGSGGSAPFEFSYNINGGTTNTVTTLSGQNSISVDVPTNLSGTFKYELVSVSNGDGCSNTQNGSATITVKELPTLSTTLTPTGICANSVFTYVPTSASSGASFTWSRAAITENPASSGNGNPNEMLVNNTAAALTAVYAFTTTADGCSNTENVSVIVSPLPTLTSTLTPEAICSNRLFSYEPTSDLDGTTFSWHRIANPAIKVGSIANTDGNGTGNPNEILLNTSKAIQYVTYEFTLESNGCTNPTIYPVVIQVKPAPLVTTADKVLICPGTSVSLSSTSDIVSSLPTEIRKQNFNDATYIWSANSTTADGIWTPKSDKTIINSETFRSNDHSTFYASDMTGANAETTSTLTSPSFSTVGYNSLSLSFYHYYDDKDNKDNAKVQVSTDNINWDVDLIEYTSDKGSCSSFELETINLSAYIGQPNVYIRFYYTAKKDFYWAIDNVIVSGTPAPPVMSWSSDPPGFTSSDPSTTATPTETTTYYATYKDPSPLVECPGISWVTVVVRPEPVVTIDANYCTGNGKVRLTASPGKNYVWSTGETTQSIEVDVAGYFQVTVTDENGCVGQKDITVSNNLVTNGDFSAGNIGFTTSYTYKPDITGINNELGPEGLYGVGANAYNYHGDFFGKDHTKGSGLSPDNFMIVNGKGSDYIVWEETVNVSPNTDYYFSAWAMNLNDAGNYARLQFEINTDLAGSTVAELSTAETPADNSKVKPSNWIRFYSQPLWNSGSNTTAKIRIRNLKTNPDGNDFGIDDISFGTLNVAPFHVDITDNDPCEQSDLKLSANITGGNYPLTYAWSGPNSFTSTIANPTIDKVTLDAAGTYSLLITDHYNCVYTTTKTVAIHPISKRTSAYLQSICSGSTFTITLDDLGDPSGTTYTWSAPTGTGFTGGTAQSTGAASISQTLVNTTSSPVVATYRVTPTTGSCVGLPFDLVVTIDPAAMVSAGLDQIVCAGSSVTLAGTIGGATTGVTWSASGGTFSNNSSLTSSYTPGISSGSVTLTLTTNDPTGSCPASTSTVAIKVNEAPQVTVTNVTPVKCYGASTGAIDISVSKGTAPYTYVWSNGATTQNLSNLTAGIYTVTVKDAVGCRSTTSVTVAQPTSAVALSIVSIENVICTENSVGSATVLASGGTPDYAYSWNTAPIQTGAKATFSATGNYMATATDANGCSATVTVPITIEANTPPVVTACPPTINLEGCSTAAITTLPYSTVTSSITADQFTAQGGAGTDNCGIVSYSYKDVKNGSCPMIITRTYTLTDAKGLTGTCQQTIMIDDNTPPQWSDAFGNLDRSIVYGVATDLTTAQTLAPSASDNCDASVTLVKTSGSYIQSGFCPQTGTYTNTWVAKDKCGNVSSIYTQTISVYDKEKPVWNTKPGELDRTVSCSDGSGLTAAQALFPVASDFSDHDVTNLMKVSGSFVPLSTCPNGGTYTNTWTVTDDCGNVSDIYTQVITVVDSKAPVWTNFPGQLDVKVDCGDDGALTAAQLLAPEATDNCGTPVYTKTSGDFVPGACGNTGTYTNTWTATDQCGNVSSTYKQMITIQDITPPTVICPPGLAINTGASTNPSATGNPIVTDYCDETPIVSYTDVVIPGSCEGTYTIERTWSAKDDCGNIGSCIQTINVQDVMPPFFSTPPPMTISWCVKSIENAKYYAPTIDITPTRPDYYILSAADKSLLDLNTSTFWDNGVNNPALTLRWRIDYGGVVKAPLTGTGSLSAYAGEIRFEGQPSGVVTSKITYWLVDPCGNVSTTVVTEIKILPRPEIIKTTH